MIILRDTDYVPRQNNNLRAILKEFEDSGKNVKEVLYGTDYVNVYSCANSLRKAIGYTKKKGIIKVVIEDGRVFLMRII